MNFSTQMYALFQAIWTLRGELNPDTGEPHGFAPLEHKKVETVACEILKSHTKKGETPLVVRRQSWYGKNAKEEWQAIRRAIDAEKPLPQHKEVEDEIAKFDDLDPARRFQEQIRQLSQRIAEQDEIIEGHDEKFEEFRTKAYTNQYIEKRTLEDSTFYEEEFKKTQKKLEREERQRKGFQADNKELRAQVKELEKIAKAKGATHGSGAKPMYKAFYPDISKIELGDPKEMLKAYARFKDEAWEKMTASARKTPPTDIYLIYHSFNIDVQTFITDTLPLCPGVVSFVFACYEPTIDVRVDMFEEASAFLSTPPVVFLVHGSPKASDNVVQISSAQRDVAEQLHEHVRDLPQKSFDFYDPFEEGYNQVWIERIHP